VGKVASVAGESRKEPFQKKKAQAVPRGGKDFRGLAAKGATKGRALFETTSKKKRSRQPSIKKEGRNLKGPQWRWRKKACTS